MSCQVDWLSLERIGELHEELSIARLEAARVRQRAVVAVADEHHRLPIELVGEKRRPAEFAAPDRDRRRIERWIARRADVLRDAAREQPRGERVGPLHTRDSGEEQTPAPAFRGIDVEPSLI